MSGCDENASLVLEIDTSSTISRNLTEINKNLPPRDVAELSHYSLG